MTGATVTFFLEIELEGAQRQLLWLRRLYVSGAGATTRELLEAHKNVENLHAEIARKRRDYV